MKMNEFRTCDHCFPLPQGQLQENYDETGSVTRFVNQIIPQFQVEDYKIAGKVRLLQYILFDYFRCSLGIKKNNI